MNPVAFEIFGMPIRWYGILISIGILLGTIIAMKRAKKEGIDGDKILDLLLFAVPAAVLGARAYYVIFNWEYYSGDFSKMINVREGGLAIHGAILAAALVAYFYCKYNNLGFWKIADICAPSIILGQAIGRWGNFINQEAHGGPTDLPWGIMVNGVKVHPTFLYESLWNFFVFGFLLWYDKRKKFNGELFLIYAIMYSFIRYFVEGLRTDSLMLGEFRVAQLISILIIIVCTGAIYFFRKARK